MRVRVPSVTQKTILLEMAKAIKIMILDNKIKLAVQKEGRLTDETLSFLRQAGLVFESYRQKLFSSCRNFALEIVFVRDNDIGDYVSSGVVDLGILGQNLLFEQRPKVKKILNLRYGFCSLVAAVPKESKIEKIKDLDGKKIATSYPKSCQIFFAKNKIEVEIIPISGSVEIAPVLGVAEAIVDLSSTGSTLVLNDLRFLAKIFDSEAVLIANNQINNKEKEKLLEQLLNRFKGVLSARKNKYVFMDVPKKILPKLERIIPKRSLSPVYLKEKNKIVTLQSTLKEDFFWEITGQLKKLGVTNIVLLPVEKIIT